MSEKTIGQHPQIGRFGVTTEQLDLTALPPGDLRERIARAIHAKIPLRADWFDLDLDSILAYRAAADDVLQLVQNRLQS